MLKLHEMQEARTTVVTNMRALADLAEAEKRDLTADEDAKFGQLKATLTGLDKKIGRAQTLAEAERRSDKAPIIHLKPTFMGMSIDLNELWRRFRRK
jgi:HK97 family phage major capsid protein